VEPKQMSPAATGQGGQAATGQMLPVLIFGIVEVRRLKREIEALDEYMRQTGLREPGKQPALPRVSRLLDALAADNSRSLLQETARKELYDFLSSVETDAPSVHISFASDPSSAFTAKVVTWLRTNIHPAVLVQTGLQPTMAAGCVLRTPNHSFDFSLRSRFDKRRDLLLNALDAITAPPAPAAAPEPSLVPTAEVPAAAPVAVAATATPQPQPGVPAA
jgi:hypothetical protein